MPSHYATLGFDISSDEELGALAKSLVPQAVPIETPSGTYLRWSSASGVELWIHRDVRGEIVGAHPHFAGESQMPMLIEETIDKDWHTELDGTFSGWAHPDDDGDGLYPMIIDLANYRQVSKTKLPAMGKLQVAGLAYQMWAFDTPGEFKSQPGEKFASQAFIPASALDDEGRAEALIIGHVIASGVRTNEVTGRVLHWAQVESYGGRFDLVAHPSVLATVPKVGGVVKGTFWLTARVLDLQSA